MGTWTFQDGRKYVGEFRNGKFNGKGTYFWPDGNKFEGEFKDDKRLNGITYNIYGDIVVKYSNGEKK